MTVATTDETATCLSNLQPLWHEKASRSLIKRCPSNDPFTHWTVWQKYLRNRKKPALPPFITKKNSPLLWGWPRTWSLAAIQENISAPMMLAETVMDDEPAPAPDLPHSLQSVALAYALPELARELPAEIWWQLLEGLHELVLQIKDQRVGWPADPRDVLRHQLLAGELPLALGYLFPEVRAMRALRPDARAALSEALVDLTDGQGLPDARLLPVLGPLFACWTRTRWIGTHLSHGSWSPAAEGQYEWLVRHAIRLADRDGAFLLTARERIDAENKDSVDEAWTKNLFAMAIDLAGDCSDRAAASVALPRGVVSRELKCDAADLPRPSLNSDWAGITVMADGWSQADTRLAVSYVADSMTIDQSIAGEKLFSGLWSFETSCEGRPMLPTGDWVQLCWERSKRFDLLELGRELTEGLRLERQMLYGRDDQVLYLCDTVISREPTPRTIRHSFTLPIGPTVRWQPEVETRDGSLVGQKARAAVLPLALREWRADPRGGTLEEHDGRLILSQEILGRAVCCPLLLDLDPKRAKKQRTWRQLTVGENLEIVANDVAVGFRAQSGHDQWLFYRSLGLAGNRTVLGQNLAGEFCAGRFLTTGKLKEWIEIEAV